MNNLISLKNIKNKGFTMVETLVAVAILMISIAGPLTIAQKGLTAAIYARDQVIASFLAQDAMEFLKNVRDNNIILGSSFLNVISTCSASSKCTVDTTPSVISGPIATAVNTILYNDDVGYKTSGTNETQFSRDFYLKNITASEATIVVEVTWSNGTVQNIVSLEDQIFNIVR